MSNILVYVGAGVDAPSADAAQAALRTLCRDQYDVHGVDAAKLARLPWDASARLLVLPSTTPAFAPAWTSVEHGAPSAAARVDAYLERGGRVLALGVAARDLSARDAMAWTPAPDGLVVQVDAAAAAGADVRVVTPGADATRARAVVVARGGGRLLLCGDVAPSDAARWAPWLEALGVPVGAPPAVPALTPLYLASRSGALLDGWLARMLSAPRATAAAAPVRAPVWWPSAAVVQDTTTMWAVAAVESAAAAQEAAVWADEAAAPVSVLVLAPALLAASAALTPYFDLARYFRELVDARGRVALCPWPSARSFHVTLGDVVGYGRVVTSTQTLLETNRQMRAACRPGTTLFATQQRQGRGRGGNVWLSPAGCLQFSTLVSVPLAAGSKAVFLQYLAALALVYGVGARFPAVRGRLRIKWPNDLYAEVRDARPGAVAVAVDGAATARHYVKIGGILVSAVAEGDALAAVVGCGVNCWNDQPTTSVRALVAEHAGAAAAAEVTQEACAGAALATLEAALRVWADASYTFRPFVHAYRAAWLHSDQTVTLPDDAAPRRIVGVTSDYGLLRTVPLGAAVRAADAAAWSDAAVPGAVDVQPDGNSYDMLAGLVRRKT